MRTAILGIGGALGHDANAALIVDGELIASCQEERMSRIKHDGAFPRLSIDECLNRAGITSSEVSHIVFAEKPLQSRFFDLTGRPGNAFTRFVGKIVPEAFGGLYQQQARCEFPKATFRYAWHHLSHVSGAFYTSSFSRSAFLCVDGKGEDYSASAGTISDHSIDLSWVQPYENGLGLFYTLITHFLGFTSFGSEYKVMGLAPFGNPSLKSELSRLYTTDENGGFRLKQSIRFNHSSMQSVLPAIAEILGISCRTGSDTLDAIHIDLASSLQAIFEEELLKMATFLRKSTGEENLIFCGGCAQNCVAAGKLRERGIFKRLFNSPVGGDMGSALGAALLLQKELSKSKFVRTQTRGYYLGSEPGPPPAEAHPYRVLYAGDLHDFVAGQLADGKVIGWVRGGMELGARALGARSILADPRQPRMQSVLNMKVKFRESFRPFAPAILAEHVSEWFDSAEESDYMNYTANLLPTLRIYPPDELKGMRERLDFTRCSIPSVVHVDFSARLQTVRKTVHPDFYKLISAFGKITGVPILINTSFNVSGQPIVRTASEAWECFTNTDIDLLVIDEKVFKNPGRKSREEKLKWLKQFAKSA